MSTDQTDGPFGVPAALRLREGLTPLVACPLCGADSGYTLRDGSTYCWWILSCAQCGEEVGECRADRTHRAGAALPQRWHLADDHWTMVGAHAQQLRVTIEEQRLTIAALMVGTPDDGTTPVIRRIAALEADRDMLRATFFDEPSGWQVQYEAGGGWDFVAGSEPPDCVRHDIEPLFQRRKRPNGPVEPDTTAGEEA